MLQEKVKPQEKPSKEPSNEAPGRGVMKKLAVELYRSSPLCNCPENRRSIVDATTATVLGGMEFFGSLQDLLDNSVFLNTDVRMGEGAILTKEQLLVQECSSLKETMPSVEIPPPDLLGYNVLALKPHEMKEVILAKYKQWILYADAIFRNHIEARVRQRFYGRAESHEDDATVSRYWFSRNVIEHSSTAVREKPVVTSESREWREDAPYSPNRSWRDVKVKRVKVETTKDYVMRRLHGWHCHEIYESKWHPLPAREVPQPEFIKRLIKTITHPLLKANVLVLAGEMAKETITERDIGEKRWSEVTHQEVVTEEIVNQGRLSSPAICLGDLVLAGWSGSDLPKQERGLLDPGLVQKLMGLFKNI